MATFPTVDYNSVNDSTTSSFKNPRQKMWGVMVKADTPQYHNCWNLTLVTNDSRQAKDKVKEWLCNPVQNYSIPRGINNVILGEIIPIDNSIINA